MADKNLTAEQKLLKLIEDSQGSEKTKPEKTSFNFSKLLSPQGLKAYLTQIRELALNFFKQTAQGNFSFNFAAFSKVLRICVILTLIGLGFFLLYEAGIVNQDLGKKFAVNAQNRENISLSPLYRFSPDIFSRVEKHNIFVAANKRTGSSTDAANESLELVTLTKDLKLTGISVNPNDAAKTFCMVEDLKKSVTSFLRVGDSISGLKVKSISDDTVVLNRGKEEVVLR